MLTAAPARHDGVVDDALDDADKAANRYSEDRERCCPLSALEPIEGNIQSWRAKWAPMAIGQVRN
jgi:hypothetical protein